MPLFNIGFVIFPDLTQLDFTGAATRIINEVKVVDRVVYGVTSNSRARLSWTRSACNVRGRRLASA